ncbi:MAG: PLDc N-terminal domain-containing protein [Microbacterium arborescens]
MIDTASLLVTSDGWLTGDVLPGVAASAVAIVALVLGALAVLLFVSSLISILLSARYTGGGKLLWIIGIFVFPIAGPLVWWLGGRSARIRTDQP